MKFQTLRRVSVHRFVLLLTLHSQTASLSLSFPHLFSKVSAPNIALIDALFVISYSFGQKITHIPWLFTFLDREQLFICDVEFSKSLSRFYFLKMTLSHCILRFLMGLHPYFQRTKLTYFYSTIFTKVFPYRSVAPTPTAAKSSGRIDSTSKTYLQLLRSTEQSKLS